jgi:hypothetical protein
MRGRNTLAKIISFSLVIALTFTACKSDKDRIPFSSLTFDTTYDEMIEELGEPTETTVTYLGDTYSYAGEYLQKDGNVRYTFDEDGKMASITWLYSSEDGEEVSALYADIHKQLENNHGKTTESSDDVTQLSDIWRLDSGNISLVAVISSDYNGLMYTYMSKDHSTSAEELNQ